MHAFVDHTYCMFVSLTISDDISLLGEIVEGELVATLIHSFFLFFDFLS